MTLTDRQRRFLAAVDDAIKNDGRVAAHRAVAPDGWFFPSDVWTGSTPIAAQLFLKGALERLNAASSPSPAPPNGPAFREAPVVQAYALQIDPVSFARETFVMSKVDVVAGVPVIELSARTRDRLQSSAVDHAIYSMVRSGDVAPNSFGRYVLDALIDDLGVDMAKAIARSCRPSPAAYHRVLHAINDRNRSSDAST